MKKITLSEVRSLVRDEITKSLNEHIGFETAVPRNEVPTTFEEFRESFRRAFEKLNLKQIAGKAMNLNESNAVVNTLDRMWASIDRELTGFTGAPPPAFKEGREFWDYFSSELNEDLARLIESAMPATKLAKGNAAQIAKSVLDALRAGV